MVCAFLWVVVVLAGVLSPVLAKDGIGPRAVGDCPGECVCEEAWAEAGGVVVRCNLTASSPSPWPQNVTVIQLDYQGSPGIAEDIIVGQNGLREITIRGEVGGIASGAFRDLSAVGRVVFVDATITQVATDAFFNLSNFGEISFSDCHIDTMADGPFREVRGLGLLEFGGLSPSPWHIGSEYLKGLSSLGTLRLRLDNMDIHTVPGAFSQLPALSTLEYLTSLSSNYPAHNISGHIYTGSQISTVQYSNLHIPSIDQNAFTECEILTLVFDKTPIDYIQSAAFSNTSFLSLNFRDSFVAAMAVDAIHSMTSLGELVFSTTVANVSEGFLNGVPPVAFSDVGTVGTLWYTSSSVGFLAAEGLTLTSDMFNGLNVSLIQFTNIHIPSVQPHAFRGSPVKILRFYTGDIDILEPNSFSDLTDMDKIEFQGTPVKMIRTGAFSYMSNIGTLSFYVFSWQTGAQPGSLEPGAFAHIDQLSQLLFDGDVRYTSYSYHLNLTSELFVNLTNVGLVKFRDAEITHIGPNAFQNCQVTNIDFYYSTINEIQNTAFSSLGEVGRILFYDTPIGSIRADAFSDIVSIGELTFHSGDIRRQSPHIGMLDPATFTSINKLDSLTFRSGIGGEWATNGMNLTTNTFKELSSITNVMFDRIAIKQIDPMSFAGSSFGDLHFRSSNFQQLTSNAFSGIKSVSYLKFEFVIFQSIEPRCISNMGVANIEFVQCTLTSLPTEMFFNLSDVNHVYFLDTYIPQMASNTFKNVSRLNELQFYTSATGFVGDYTSALLPETLSGIDRLGILWFNSAEGGALNTQGMNVTTGLFSSLPEIGLLQWTNVLVTNVEPFSFVGAALQRIRFYGSNIDTLHPNSFSSIRNIEEIEFNDSPITVIKQAAFSNMVNITLIRFMYYAKITSQYNIETIEPRAFSDIDGLNELLFDGDVSYLFYNYKFDLTPDTFHNLTKVGLIKFNGVEMTAIQSVSFQNCSIANIDFYFCNISLIDNNAFSSLKNVERINFYDSPVGTIRDRAFADINGLGQLIFLSGDRRTSSPPIGQIGNEALRNINGLELLTFQSLVSGVWYSTAFSLPQDIFTGLTKITALRFERIRFLSLEPNTFANSNFSTLTFIYSVIQDLKAQAFSGINNINTLAFDSVLFQVIASRAFSSFGGNNVDFLRSQIPALVAESFYMLNVSGHILFEDTSIELVEGNAFSQVSAEGIHFFSADTNPVRPMITKLDPLAFRSLGTVGSIWFNSNQGAAFNKFPMNVTSGLFANLSNTANVQLNYINVENIEPGAYEYSNIGVMRFYFCTIQSIQSTGFSHISLTKQIYFQGTKIERIESLAFSQIANMTSIKFQAYSSLNVAPLIGSIDQGAFSDIHNLGELVFDSDINVFSFSFNISLTSNMAQNVTKLGLFRLTSGYVPSIGPETFSDIQVDNIEFNGCEVVLISDDAFKTSHTITKLEFRDTPIGTISQGAFRGMSGADTLSFYSGNGRSRNPHIKSIEAGTFQNAGPIGSLQFRSGFGSSLNSYGMNLTADVFGNLQSVQEIIFQMVKIPRVEPHAFAGGNAATLQFISCTIEDAPARAFSGTDSMVKMSFEFTTFQGYEEFTFSDSEVALIHFIYTPLSSLPTNVFYNITGRIVFEDSPIDSIAAGAFTSVSVQEIQFYTTAQSSTVAPYGTMDNDAFRSIASLQLLWFNSVAGGYFDRIGLNLTSGPLAGLKGINLIQFNMVTMPVIQPNVFSRIEVNFIRFFFCDIGEIQADAFNQLSNIRQIFFQGTPVISIKAQAFHNLQNIDSISFYAYPTINPGSNPTVLESMAFSNIHKLGLLAFDADFVPGTTAFSYKVDLYSGLLHNMTGVGTFTLTAAEVGFIGTDTFMDCEVDTIKIVYCKIGEIRPGAFNGRMNISSIDFEGSPISVIRQGAFGTGPNIGEIQFSSSDTLRVEPHIGNVESGAFQGPGHIGSLVFRSRFGASLHTYGLNLTKDMFKDVGPIDIIRFQYVRVPNIMTDAFGGTSANDITFLYSAIGRIGGSAFSNLHNSKSIVFDQGQVSFIEDMAFNEVSNAEKIHFTQAGPIIDIASNAFTSVHDVTSVTFTRSPVDYIRSRAFSGLENVQYLVFEDSPVQCMDTGAFLGMGDDVNLTASADEFPCQPPLSDPGQGLEQKHCSNDSNNAEICPFEQPVTFPTTTATTTTTTTATTTTTTTITTPTGTTEKTGAGVPAVAIWLPCVIVGAAILLIVYWIFRRRRNASNKEKQLASPSNNLGYLPDDIIDSPAEEKYGVSTFKQDSVENQAYDVLNKNSNYKTGCQANKNTNFPGQIETGENIVQWHL